MDTPTFLRLLVFQGYWERFHGFLEMVFSIRYWICLEHFIGIGRFHRNRKSSWIWDVSSELEVFMDLGRFIGQVGLLKDLGGLFHRIQNGLQNKSFWILDGLSVGSVVFQHLGSVVFHWIGSVVFRGSDTLFGFHRIRIHLSKAPYIY
jgi:hypothetical protein